jgi:hypothetical protein
MTLRRTLLPALAACLIAPAAAPAVEPGTVIGLNTTVDEVAKTKEAGGKWVRLFTSWAQIEPDQGRFADNHVQEFQARARAFHAAGIKVIAVLNLTPPWANGNGPAIRPPSDPALFGSFAGRIAAEWRDFADAYEIWNEPDGPVHWENGPRPGEYTGLLKAAYGPIKAADPTATVVTGGTIGGNFSFIESLYKAGAKGSFDAVGVHTDIACMAATPEFQYRDPQGRIGQYVFTAYREVRATMGDFSDLKPIWITEMGWPTPGANQKCLNGGKPLPGKEDSPGGVSEEDQGAYLRRGLQCLQGDPYVEVATWFSLQDIDTGSPSHENRFGLIRSSGVEKDSFREMAKFSAAPSTSAACGEPVDREPPTVTSATPPEGFKFTGPLTVQATATDNLTVNKMELFVDGQKIGGQQAGAKLAFTPWDAAKKLPNGKHTLLIKAYDGALNVGTKTISVQKVDPSQLTVAPAKVAFGITQRSGRRITFKGKVGPPPGATEKPRGKMRIFVQIKKGKRYKTVSRYTKGIAKPFNFTIKLKKKGTYRIYARYAAQKPYKAQRTKPVTIKVK